MRSLALVLVLWSGLAAAAGGQPTAEAPGPLSLDGYVAALTDLRACLEEGRLDEARARARALSGREVAWEDGLLATDRTVLDPVLGVQGAPEARVHAVRIRQLVVALGASSGAVAVQARPEVLSRLTPGAEIERGGEAPRLQVKPLTFPEWVEAALLAVADWLGEVMYTLWRWIRRLIPDRARSRAGGDGGTTATVAVVFAAVVVAFLIVLALRSLRRDAVASTEAVSLPAVASSRDEDPLSREASGWEDHARELASKRRWREAIRAWYHAVLVTLFRSGLLHHQRGRTNWEYVAQLGPGLRWRSTFVSLTRRFDREWYGRRTSSGDALAECAREAREVLRFVASDGETP